MNTHFRIGFLAIGVLLGGSSAIAQAEEQHAEEAAKHLEQATESGKQGAASEAGKHADEAEQHAIQQNKKRPHRTRSKKIAGEEPKQVHDEQSFSQMEKAKGHARKGHPDQAGQSAEQAQEHLEKKEQAK